jgi:hypothetical protein
MRSGQPGRCDVGGQHASRSAHVPTSSRTTEYRTFYVEQRLIFCARLRSSSASSFTRHQESAQLGWLGLVEAIPALAGALWRPLCRSARPSLDHHLVAWIVVVSIMPSFGHRGRLDRPALCSRSSRPVRAYPDPARRRSRARSPRTRPRSRRAARRRYQASRPALAGIAMTRSARLRPTAIAVIFAYSTLANLIERAGAASHGELTTIQSIREGSPTCCQTRF